MTGPVLLISGLLLVGAVTAVAPLEDYQVAHQFASFVNKFGKVYSDEEVDARLSAFKYWTERVREHNLGNHTWTMEINEYADLMPDEFVAKYGMSSFDAAEAGALALPTDANDIDWRTKGVVPPIRNQGQCGAGWVIAPLASIAAWDAIKTGTLKDLSVQQIIDCATSQGGQGCNGGQPDTAYKFVRDKGSCTTGDYGPYTARTGQCKQGCKPVVKIPGYDIGKGEDSLAVHVNECPIAVGLDASGSGFQMYHSGVFTGPCGKQINHIMLVVGYTQTYWILANTWGTSWGMGGYIYIQRGKGLCGIGDWFAFVTEK